MIKLKCASFPSAPNFVVLVVIGAWVVVHSDVIDENGFTPTERYATLADCEAACLDPDMTCQQVRSWLQEWECLTPTSDCLRLGNFASTVKAGDKVIRGPTWPGSDSDDLEDSCFVENGMCIGECVIGRCRRSTECVGVVEDSVIESCDPADGTGCVIISVDWGCGGNPPNISTYQIGGNFCDVVPCRSCFVSPDG